MSSSDEEFTFSRRRPLTNGSTSHRQPSTSRQGGSSGGNRNAHGRPEDGQGRQHGAGTTPPPPSYSTSQQHRSYSRSGASASGSSRRGPSAGGRPQTNGDERSSYEQSNGYRSSRGIESEGRDRETSASRSRHESNPRSGGGGNSRLTNGYINGVSEYGHGRSSSGGGGGGRIDEGLGYHTDGRIGEGYYDEYGATDSLGRPRFGYSFQSSSSRNNGGQYGGGGASSSSSRRDDTSTARGSSGLTNGYGSGLAHTRGGTNGYGGPAGTAPRMAYYPSSSSS